MPITIDLQDVRSGEELHALLAARLGFPTFYGRNWDAFWDAITGLVELPAAVRLVGWQGFAARLPEEARQLHRCLGDFARELPGHTAIEYA